MPDFAGQKQLNAISYGLILQTVLKQEKFKRELCRELKGERRQLLMEQYSIDPSVLKGRGGGVEKASLNFLADSVIQVY